LGKKDDLVDEAALLKIAHVKEIIAADGILTEGLDAPRKKGQKPRFGDEAAQGKVREIYQVADITAF
jgi:hypothetical protein